jgi:hypothetical protein
MMKRWSLVIVVMLLALATTVSAQEDSAWSTVSADGVALAYPHSLGPNVNIVHYAGDDPSLGQPGGPLPPYTEFQLYEKTDEPVDYLAWNGKGYVTVYHTADFANYPLYQDQLTALQKLLTDAPALDSFMAYDSNQPMPNLPFLPVYPAAQVIRAAAQYAEIGSLKGIIYLTVFRQDASPFLNNEFYYTFQGVTADGAVYVSARFPVVVPGVPAELPADFDYDAWVTGIDQYMNDTMAALTAADAASFAPSLTELNDVFNSIVVNTAAG